MLLVAAVLKQPRQSGFLIDYFQPYLLSVPNLVAGVVIGILLTAGDPALVGTGARRHLPFGESPPRQRRPAARDRRDRHRRLPPARGGHRRDRRTRRPPRLRSHPGPGGGLPGGGQWAHSAGRLHRPVRQPAAAPPRAGPEDLPTLRSPRSRSPCARCRRSRCSRSSAPSGRSPGAPWTALALFLPFLALALFPWNDNGPYRNFDANYYGDPPGPATSGPFVLAWLCARLHPAPDPDLGAVRLRRPGGRSTTSSSACRRCSRCSAPTAVGSERVRPDPRRLGALRGRGRGRAARRRGARLRGHPGPHGRAAQPDAAHLLQPPLPARFVRPRADALARAPLGPLRHLCRRRS